MRSGFTADNRPPIEPPATLDPDTARYWSIVAEQWHPDDEVRDRILAGMLARADQTTTPEPIRVRLHTEAQRVLHTHQPDPTGMCTACDPEWQHTRIPCPCWSVRLAHRVAPSPTEEPELLETGNSDQ